MVVKTYYAKLDCSSSATATVADKVTNEYYRSFLDFMSYLTQSNVASLVAWNSGSNVVSASFNQRGYWDQTNIFGGGAHTIWKFPSSSTRPFDWYLYTQVFSGSYAQNIRQPFNLPISGFGANADSFGGSSAAVLVQAAVCYSGSSSFNPWNGTGVSDGNDTASSPRWVSGANGRILSVLPRSNDPGGNFPMNIQKSNTVAMGASLTSSTKARWHFIFDGDALISYLDTAMANTYSFFYVGPFELRNSLTSSGICNGPFGFMMHSSFATTTATPNFQSTFGDAAGTTTSTNGGVFVPISASSPYVSDNNGSKGGTTDTIATFFATAYQTSSYTGKLDEFPVYVGANDPPYVGYLGTLNTGLVRWVLSASNHDTTSNNSKAVFGGSSVLTDKKAISPWTGSTAPGQNPTSRSGSNFTWTANYG